MGFVDFWPSFLLCVSFLPDAFAFHAKLVVPFYIRSDFDKKFRICKTALILQLLRNGMVAEKIVTMLLQVYLTMIMEVVFCNTNIFASITATRDVF